MIYYYRDCMSKEIEIKTPNTNPDHNDVETVIVLQGSSLFCNDDKRFTINGLVPSGFELCR